MLNEESGILISDAGIARTTTVSTLPEMLLHSTSRWRKPDAFRFKRNSRWFDVSTDEFLLRVEELFFGLRTLGLNPRHRVAIISENRLEWAVADYATLCAGATTVPVYPTLSASEIEALLRHSDPRIVFVSTAELLNNVAPAIRKAKIPHVIVFDSGMQSLLEIGRQRMRDLPHEFQRSARAVRPDDLATIIYTSGTTGTPKGAMLTHRNLLSNIVATCERLPVFADDVSLSFLPLSHIFQRHVDYAAVFSGATIAYAETLATVSDDMLQVRPTFAAGVPRFFEKVYGRIVSEVAQRPAVVRTIFEKALAIGFERVRTGKTSLAHKAADEVVFRTIRGHFGGRLKFFISGGAALQKEIAEFFWAVGLPIYEGYGLTETSPVITLNGPGATRLGTVGRTLGDQEIRIAADGEILVRGSNVMKGYYRSWWDSLWALSGGWFHTGDIGEIDADGFLRVTDRKKDLIVTSSGKNVAPQPIENRLKSIPYFNNVIVVGDHRNFISALVVPNYPALVAYARAHNIEFDRPQDLAGKPEIYQLAMNEIAQRTRGLAPFEKIRKIAFLDGDFSIDGGELTPTLKVRRSAVEKKYAASIQKLYAA